MLSFVMKLDDVNHQVSLQSFEFKFEVFSCILSNNSLE